MSGSLPLVEWDARRGRWSVGEEAAALLSAHAAPLAVAAVAGAYRSGKSFLVSQLAAGAGGGGGGGGAAFSVGHTVDSHTRGIWVAARPLPARTAAGEPVDLLLLDSEGLGATDRVRGARARARAHACSRAEGEGGPPPRSTAPLAPLAPAPSCPLARRRTRNTTRPSSR
jgi:hypothetical protein